MKRTMTRSCSSGGKLYFHLKPVLIIYIIAGISVAQTINANILMAILDVQNIITMLPSADL